MNNNDEQRSNLRLVLTGSLRDDDGEDYRRVARSVGLECGLTDCIEFKQLAYRLGRQPEPDLVMVLTEPAGEDDWADMVRYASDTAGVPVLVVGPGADSKRAVRAVNSGARQYLDQAELPNELSRALDQLHGNGMVSNRRGKVVSVTSATEGSGVTTTATGLAFAYAQAAPNDVILAEVGNGVPELALALDLEILHGIRKLADSWQRSDARMVAGAMVKHPCGVSILAQPAEVLNTPKVPTKVMKKLIVLARSMAKHTVLDLGHRGGHAAIEAMQLSASVVVVSRLDVPSIRRTRAYLKQLRDADIPLDRIQVVINRYNQPGLTPWKEAEKSVEVPVAAWIPDDTAALNKALGAGKPPRMMGRSASVRAFEKLATTLAEK